MTLKKKFIIIGIITIIFIIIYLIGSHFLIKNTSREKNTKSNLDTAIDLTGDEFEITTKSIAKFIVSKDYKSIYKEFSWDFKKQTSLENFSANCESILNGVGKFISYSDIITTENEDNVIAKAFVKYSKKNICINLFLDLNGKIDSITIDYCTVPSKSKEYSEQYISIGKYSLHGLLTLPNDVKNPPVAILVHDAGSFDMDNTIGTNKMFSNIAHGLASQGIAVIRYNKRYSQYSKLGHNEHSINEEMLDDIYSAMELAVKNKQTSKDIYIIGHGLGGSLSPYIAKHNKHVKGIISLSGSPRHMADVIYDQYMCDILASNMKDNDKLIQLNNVKKDVLKVKKLKKGGKELILGFNKTYWKSLNKIDIEKNAKTTSIPMLYIQGENDSLTYVDVDFAKWKEILKGYDNVEFMLYNNLNHYLIKSNEANDSDNTKGNVSKKVILDVAKWIKNNSK